jgi:N-acetylglucosaminyldiphosphoundecaprenol N-acetyl-beta-D-mannosaminyltransferase
MSSISFSCLTFIQGESHIVAEKIIRDFKQNDVSKVLHYMYYASYFSLSKDQKLLQAYSMADYILPDGIGMQLCFLPLIGKWIINLNGTDMTPLIMQEAVAAGIPIVMYGTTKENIEGCAQRFSRDFNKKLEYYQDGFSALDIERVPDNAMLIVGTGSPRQELWTLEHINILQSKKVFVTTVGGFLDFYCGFYVRAPKIVRFFKLEWLWRTILHPARHYHKRLRDMTIIFIPLWQRMKGIHKSIRIKYI